MTLIICGMSFSNLVLLRYFLPFNFTNFNTMVSKIYLIRGGKSTSPTMKVPMYTIYFILGFVW